MHTWILITAAATAVLLACEWRQFRAGAAVAKLTASSGFVATAVAAGAHHAGAFGWAMLGALALCWIGDACLIPRTDPAPPRRGGAQPRLVAKRGPGAAFLAGLASFLAGHLLFAVAFVLRGVDWEWALAAGAVAAVPGLAVAGVLLPNVSESMRRPVLAYMGAISCMLALAVGTWAAAGGALLPLAAAAFYVSDLAVARDRFLAPGLANRLLGLPLYYAAQILFAVMSGG